MISNKLNKRDINKNNKTKPNIRPGSIGIIAKDFLSVAQRLHDIKKAAIAGPPIVAAHYKDLI